jgi:hypothetical protein
MHCDAFEARGAQVIGNFVAIAPIARERTPPRAAHP